MLTLQSILDALKLPPRYLAAIAIFCGTIVLLPESVSGTIGIHGLQTEYQQWFGVGFLAAAILLGIHYVSRMVYFARKWMIRRKAEKLALEKLRSLTEEEKQILRFYIATGSKSNTLRIDDGVVNGLVAHGIIYRAATMGNMLEGFSHNISELAWNCLHEHPELLSGTTQYYRTDKGNRQWFR